MIKNEKQTFAEVFQQNSRRTCYHKYQMTTRACDRRGIFPLYQMYRKQKPDLGLLATYFHYAIRYHLVLLQEDKEKQEYYNGYYIHEIVS